MAYGIRLTYEYVKEVFEKNGCQLLSNKYINNLTKLDYICNCGNQSQISLSNFQKGKRCRDCANLRLSKERRFSFEFVQNIFKLQNCILLEKEYINAHVPLKFSCPNGHINHTNYNNFIHNKPYPCRLCRNPNYFTSDNQEKRDRDNPSYKNWRKNIWERDDYSCQICKKRGRLAAHHLNAWGWCIKGRFDITNGITLCDGSNSCHSLFHKTYGYGNNTLEQFTTFKNSILFAFA